MVVASGHKLCYSYALLPKIFWPGIKFLKNEKKKKKKKKSQKKCNASNYFVGGDQSLSICNFSSNVTSRYTI